MRIINTIKILIICSAVAILPAALAAELSVEMHLIDSRGDGPAIGSVALADSRFGLLITPALTGLSSGIHGFHVHQNGSCAAKQKDGRMVAGLSAGGHFDPAGSNHHDTPWGDGHLGDLPGLVVAENGSAHYPVLAPRVKLADIEGRALMIHMGGDNYADRPHPLGGGGARVACGVIGR